MKISYFDEDQTDYERAQQIKDENGEWTTVGEQEDKELEDWADYLDEDDFDPGPDCADAYERNLEYNMMEW